MSFFLKVMRESVIWMSADRVFKVRGPAIEKTLSESRNRVRRTAKLPRAADRSRVLWQRIAQFCEVLWCDTMLDIEHQAVGLELDSNKNNNVRLLQLQLERYNRTNICHAGQH